MRRFIVLWVFVCVLVSACAAPLSQNNSSDATNGASAETPFYAWDFTLESLSGETYTLSELRGQWVLINFWATWCVPCRDEMPELELIADVYAEDLIVLGINQRESAERAGDFVAELGVSFPILMNPPDQVLLDYQVTGLPLTFLVDPNGELVMRHAGPITLEEFDRLFAEL